MTPSQIAIIRDTFSKIVPIKEAAAALFYDRLFAVDPSTRRLFRGEMVEQGAKLMMAIAMVVKSLDHIDPMLEPLRALARRHVNYGVENEHYASVGAALLWTLEQGLGSDFTEEVREAWTSAYELLSGTMMKAAAEVFREAA
jgi:hemoglobin-like flavoprotein